MSESSTTITSFANLAEHVAVVPDGIVSRTLYNDDTVRVVLFAFDAGQQLTEHTSAHPAIIEIIRGEAQLTLGAEQASAQAGFWVHMPAHLPHAVVAVTPVIMLLTMVK